MKNLLIVGMHRSGTSAVARIANLLGFNLGPVESMGQASSDNPKGFWEQIPVRNLNDFLLASTGAAWNNPYDFAVDRLSDKARFDFFCLANRFVTALRGDAPCAIKDPRLSLTLNAWRPLLQESMVLLVYRNPHAVARSLKARNGISHEFGLALWEKYVVEALNNSASMPRFAVDYGDVVSTPIETAARLYEQLSEYFPGALSRIPDDELLAFVDPSLNHQGTSDDESGSSPGLNNSQRELVEVVQEAVAGGFEHNKVFRVSSRSERLLRAVADLRATERVLAPVESSVATGQSRAADNNEGTGVGVEEVEQTAGQLADHLPEASRLHSSVGTAGEQAEGFEARLSSLEQRVHAQDLLLEGQNREPEAVRDRLAARAAATVEKSTSTSHTARRASEAITELQQLLAETRVSWRWKIGNAAVRLVEMALFRGRPMLAIDAMESGLTRLKTMLEGLSAPAVSQHDVESSHLLEREQFRVLNELPLPGKLDIVVFPIIDWHFRIQRPQHIAREMALRGHRVFYLTIAPRGGAAEHGYRLLEMPEHGVFICELQIRSSDKFDLYGGKVTPRGLEDIRAALESLWRSQRIAESISIVQHPSWHGIAGTIPASFLVYDCMDHHAGFSTHTRDVGMHEQALLESSDLVVVTSQWLERLHSAYQPRVIRNAADIDRFLPLSKADHVDVEDAPVVGYVGTIAEWFDMRLIVQSAKKFKNWKFILVGSTSGCDTSEAERLSNVVFEGERPYSEVGEYLKRFDVCIIPFKLTDLIKATNPVKIYEYLAAGKPVVSVELPELEPMRELIHLARDAKDWKQKLQLAMDERGDSDLIRKRSEWARKNSWARRAAALETAIFEKLPAVSIVILAYNNLIFSKACIESVLKHTHYPHLEIIIVDNGSSDGSPEYFREISDKHGSVKVLRNEENLGFAGGNNRGMKVATGDVVVLLNNDTYVAPGWLYALVSKMNGPSGLDLAGPVTNNIGNEAKINIAYDSMDGLIDAAAEYTWQHAGEIMAIQNLAFFCVAISRQVIDSIGLLDESFQGGFFEDDDYCRRALDAGFRLGIVEDSFVHHHLSASFDQLGKERKLEIFEANKAVFERKWGAWKQHNHRKWR